MLRKLLKKQLNFTKNEKLAERVRMKVEEANTLQRHHDEMKKYLEQKMKDQNLEKSFASFVNFKEIICLEVKDCNEIEKNIFERLSL